MERRLATVFTRLIGGELPARFVWRDDLCVAFLNITPLSPGHTLVVPKEEVDDWLNLEPLLAAHLMSVAQAVGKAIMRRFEPEKVGLMIAGLEIPYAHVHVHVRPIHGPLTIPVAVVDGESPDPDWRMLDRAAGTIRRALTDLGFQQHVAG